MRLPVFVLALGGLIAGCSPLDIELLPDGGGLGDADVGDGGGGACTGLGPARTVGNACAGAFTAQAHRFAICSCDPLTVDVPLSTAAWDSSGGLPGNVAAVGTNGTFQSGTAVELFFAGALYAGGAVTVGLHLETLGSLHAGGPLSAPGAEANIGTDAFVAGDVTGGVEVQGTLTLPVGATVGAGVIAAGIAREQVAVPPPCDCAGASAVGLPGEVSDAVAANDDAAAGIDPRALSTGGATALDLPCGRFLLDAIRPAGDATLRVHGRATLVVAGDVALTGALAVALDDGAELDLVIGGALTTSAPVAIGSATSPPRVRLWVAGQGPVRLDGAPTLHAQLTAPAARLEAPAGLHLDGSVLAAGVLLGGRTDARYDRAVLAAGATCGAPAQLPVE